MRALSPRAAEKARSVAAVQAKRSGRCLAAGCNGHNHDCSRPLPQVYLPDACSLGAGGQLAVLLAFAALGLATLPRLDSTLARVTPPTKESLFGREVKSCLETSGAVTPSRAPKRCAAAFLSYPSHLDAPPQVAQWSVAFLVWTPWQKVLTAATESIRAGVGGQGQGLAVFACIAAFGCGVTAAIAFLSALVHSGRRSVAARLGHHLLGAQREVSRRRHRRQQRRRGSNLQEPLPGVSSSAGRHGPTVQEVTSSILAAEGKSALKTDIGEQDASDSFEGGSGSDSSGSGSSDDNNECDDVDDEYGGDSCGGGGNE